MAPSTTQPWRLVLGHDPEHPREGERDGQDAARSGAMLVIGLGFSNGWAELAL